MFSLEFMGDEIALRLLDWFLASLNWPRIKIGSIFAMFVLLDIELCAMATSSIIYSPRYI